MATHTVLRKQGYGYPDSAHCLGSHGYGYPGVWLPTHCSGSQRYGYPHTAQAATGMATYTQLRQTAVWLPTRLLRQPGVWLPRHCSGSQGYGYPHSAQFRLFLLFQHLSRVWLPAYCQGNQGYGYPDSAKATRGMASHTLLMPPGVWLPTHSSGQYGYPRKHSSSYAYDQQ